MLGLVAASMNPAMNPRRCPRRLLPLTAGRGGAPVIEDRPVEKITQHDNAREVKADLKARGHHEGPQAEEGEKAIHQVRCAGAQRNRDGSAQSAPQGRFHHLNLDRPGRDRGKEAEDYSENNDGRIAHEIIDQNMS